MSKYEFSGNRPVVTGFFAAALAVCFSFGAAAQEAPSADDAFASMLEAMSPDMVGDGLDAAATGDAISQLPQFDPSKCPATSNEAASGGMDAAVDQTYALIAECFEPEAPTDLAAVAD